MQKILSLFLILFSASAFAGWPSSGSVTCLTAGSASIGCINYNGTTQAAGQFDSGAVAPVHTNVLNYDGVLSVTNLYAGASGTASAIFVGSNGIGTGLLVYSDVNGSKIQAFNNTLSIVGSASAFATFTSTGASIQGTLSVSGQVTSNSKNVLSVNDTQTGQPGVSITVTASPFAYTATYGGSVAVGGGTVTGMTLTRNSVVVWSTTLANDIVPVRAGDIVTVTYTTAPVMYQLSN